MKWIKKVATTPLDAIAKVVDTLHSQTNDRTNAPSIRAVREAINQNWLTIYPIGSIYMCVNDINPSEVFGGTWVQIKDRFLLAAGDTYNNGATGGEATVMLGYQHIPPHYHETFSKDLSDKYDLETISKQDTGQDYIQVIKKSTTMGFFETNSAYSNEGEEGHNNMPPYLAVKIWKRTA